MKTAEELVAYCRAQLGKPYWYGTYGNTATPELYERKKTEYPDQYKDTDFSGQFGERVHDCSGLIKGFFWSDTPSAEPGYAVKGFPDINAADMAIRCNASEDMSGMPDVPGVLLFMRGHVGVYAGNGKVIEARGHRFGVVETLLNERDWFRWGYCPDIIYPEKVEHS